MGGINRRAASNNGLPIKRMTAANGNATYDGGNGIWKCSIRDPKYNKYQDKQIINHVGAKRRERQINTDKNGVARTERGMRIKGKCEL